MQTREKFAALGRRWSRLKVISRVLIFFLIFGYQLFAISWARRLPAVCRIIESECDVTLWRSSDVVPSVRTSIKSLCRTFSITKPYCFWQNILRSQYRLNRLIRNWSCSEVWARLISWKCRHKCNLTLNWRHIWIENFTSYNNTSLPM